MPFAKFWLKPLHWSAALRPVGFPALAPARPAIGGLADWKSTELGCVALEQKHKVIGIAHHHPPPLCVGCQQQ